MKSPLDFSKSRRTLGAVGLFRQSLRRRNELERTKATEYVKLTGRTLKARLSLYLFVKRAFL